MVTEASQALGSLIVLTDRGQAGRPLAEVVSAATEAGARAVVLREKDLPPERRAALVGTLRPLLDAVEGTLIVASGLGDSSASPRGGPPGSRVLGAHAPGTRTLWGAHLAAADPLPVLRPPLLGRSCHDEEELDRAAAEGVDYVTCSPVFASASKPGYGPALGPTRLGELCRRTEVPVYALGGVSSPAAASACRAAGAAGVAVMGQVMRAPDPGRIVAELLAALS